MLELFRNKQSSHVFTNLSERFKFNIFFVYMLIRIDTKKLFPVAKII